MNPSIMTFLPECPHCGRSEMTFYACGQEPRGYDALTFWKCATCRKGVCGESRYRLPERGTFDYYKFTEIYPAPSPNEAPEFTPEQVTSDFIEAVSSLKNGNYKAASLMARTSLETAVNLFNAQGANLKQKINNLANQNVITAALSEWAHEIRGIGNEAAHDAEPVKEEDARAAVDFAEMLYTYLFTLPERIAKRRQG
jgi:HEPN domain-containing protein